MPLINILPDTLKNKIAAGEVIERPASVVKELIENSLDAGAGSVEVEVEKGGRRLIKVYDDGAGMGKEDALLCFQRHATSKISIEQDLFSIGTLGFRGEALPSIASVSRAHLITALKGESLGISVRLEGGEVKEVKDSPSNGTSFEVSDLFFNTPARAKFLKTTGTEISHVVDTVTRTALSNPAVRFGLILDGNESMRLPRASSLRERMSQLYGEEFLEGLIEFSAEGDGMLLRAFVSTPSNLRQTRANQKVFVNGRPVRDKTVSHAVYSAYEGAIPGDRFPMYFVFLELDPSRVDFNVHPTKREVRFSDKQAIYSFVRRAVRENLPQRRSLLVSEPSEAEAASPVVYPSHSASIPIERVGVAEPAFLSFTTELPSIYLGDTFVAVSDGGGLTIIDHHAAHERILYEKFLVGVGIESMRLLFPRQVKLSTKEHMEIINGREMLYEMGLEIEDFGHDTVIVRSIPGEMEESDLRGVLADAAHAMIEGKRPGVSMRETVAARIACHSSVRGKAILGREGLAALISDLEKTENPDQCPHGRPTRVTYSLDELKKIFKRT